jgi:hypothetical protein
MREFRFDAETGLALLNGRKRRMVGTNAAVFRFFEDPMRGDLPWRRDWVAKLYDEFSSMHWSFVRFHISFPPAFWFDLADEKGFLIQDEYPIWGTDRTKSISDDALVEEFTRWMRERWNHPSVVIWDAQNEGGPGGRLAGRVRGLDLSRRPWDTGWSFSGEATDPIEAHPYALRYLQKRPDDDEVLQNMEVAREKGVVFRQPEYLAKHGGLAIFETFTANPFEMPFTGEGKHARGKPNPIIVNEYARLCWIHRDGRPGEGAAGYFRGLGIDPSTASEELIRETAAYYLAAQTEFWRHGRACAAVQHFVSLMADKRKTADNFVDIVKLEWDPSFKKHMPSAFAPVSVMIDLWDEAVVAGQEKVIQVSLINDLPEEWKGELTLSLPRGDKTVQAWRQTVAVQSNGKITTSFTITIPKEPGRAELRAAIAGKDGETVLSRRRLNVLEKPHNEDHNHTTR